MGKYKYPKAKVIFIINKLLDIFSVIPITEKILRNALSSSIEDYEDAVIEVSAISEGIDYIVSRDIKDFGKGKIECLSALEAVALIEG